MKDIMLAMDPTPNDREMLRTFLAERNMPCPVCGYNLRQLQSDRCPECGEALKLQVGAVEPKMAAYITGLVGLAAGAGFNWLFTLFWLSMRIRHGASINRPDFWAAVLPGLIVLSAVLVFWITRRRQIRNTALSRRAMLALACWCVVLIDLVWVSFVL